MKMTLPQLLLIIAISMIALGLSFCFAWYAMPAMVEAKVVNNAPGTLWLLWFMDTIMMLGIGTVFGIVLEKEKENG